MFSKEAMEAIFGVGDLKEDWDGRMITYTQYEGGNGTEFEVDQDMLNALQAAFGTTKMRFKVTMAQKGDVTGLELIIKIVDVQFPKKAEVPPKPEPGAPGPGSGGH